jgi:hypothetical protein
MEASAHAGEPGARRLGDDDSCGVDLETRSLVNLKKVGVVAYARDPSTDVWCLGYAFKDEDPDIWHPGLAIPERLAVHITAGRVLRAWNAIFEQLIWLHVLGPRYGFPVAPPGQWRCTAAAAASQALPRSLERAAAAVHLSRRKDPKGRALMLRMTRPRSTQDGKTTWWDDPEHLARLYEYCKHDVRLERDMAMHLGPDARATEQVRMSPERVATGRLRR